MRFVPNFLTIGRIAVTPFVLLLLFTDRLWGQGAALILFVLAAISDYWDGRLARSMDADSRLGRFLDPMADKILVLGTFVGLAVLHPEVAPWWAVVLIAVRDLGITGIRIRQESQGRTLRTIPMAKTKTTFQLVYLIGILTLLTARYLPGIVAQGALWVLQSMIPIALLAAVVVITLYTGWRYIIGMQHERPLKNN